VAHNEEDKQEEKEPFKADSNLEDFLKVLDELVSFLDNLEHTDKPSHLDQLVELGQSEDSS